MTCCRLSSKSPSQPGAHLLGISGTESILIRDYLNKNTNMIDMTVIPRFWDINQKGLRELLISVQDVVGAAGVMLTQRGLAIRAWAKDVATVRKKILPSDPRLTETNLNVVPRLVLDSSGWPPGAAASDIVEAVNKAVGSAPVPTRTFRSAGVHVWQLGFEAPPKASDFTVKINGELFQILLTPSSATEKGQGKGKASKKSLKQKQKDEADAVIFLCHCSSLLQSRSTPPRYTRSQIRHSPRAGHWHREEAECHGN